MNNTLDGDAMCSRCTSHFMHTPVPIDTLNVHTYTQYIQTIGDIQ